MPKRSDWVKRRWLDFRQGHSLYLIFTISFLQFVIVSYTLAVERLDFLKEIFPSMWMWAVFFVVVYIPLAIVLGDLHLKRQMKSEIRQQTEHNPFTYMATPGKEKEFHLPSAITGLKISSETMRITNDLADGMERIYGALNEKNALGLPPLRIERYSENLLAENAKWIYINEGLMKGGSIVDLIKEWEQAAKPSSK